MSTSGCTPAVRSVPTSASLGATGFGSNRNARKGRHQLASIPSAEFNKGCNGVVVRTNGAFRARTVASIYSTAEDVEVARLRRENAGLRIALKQRLEAMDDEERTRVLSLHEGIIQVGTTVGEIIPGLVSPPEVNHEMHETANAKPLAPGVVVEVEADNGAIIFKFADSQEASSFEGMSNGRRAVSLAGRLSGPNDDTGAVVFTFEKAAAPLVEGRAEGQEDHDCVVTANIAGEKFEEPAISPRDVETADLVPAASGPCANPRRRRSTTKTKASKATSESTSGSRMTSKKAVVDPYTDARSAARKECESHVPGEALAGKEQWLYATIPAVPVAGAPCTVYFNRAKSESLRERPRVQLHARFNNWELDGGDAGTPDRVDMSPADGIHWGDGTDFWSTTISIPTEAYEINFIFSDADGKYDNNNNLNYSLPVSGPMTRDLWIDAAAERAEAAYLKRKAEEEAAAAQAAEERERGAEAADAVAASGTIASIKANYAHWQTNAVEFGACWLTVPSPPVAGSAMKLFYNRAASSLAWIPIPEEQNIILQCGHNGWQNPFDVRMQRTTVAPKGQADGEWWVGDVEVPELAAVVDFVVRYCENYDNNGGGDYRLKVSLPAGASSVDSWADGLLASVRGQMTAARRVAEEAEAAKEAARQAAREAARAKAEEVRRRQMRHVLFTEPATPRAGAEVTLHYNPNSTVLHGAERVYLRGGFNRWRHSRAYGPEELIPPSAAGEQHHTATIAVPKDAYSLDFVLSDAVEGGRYDNLGGLDYHVPVEGSVVSEPPLYVVHIAVEMAPICKVGGLGDVVTALGRAVASEGHTVEVILPRYDFFLQSPLLGATRYETEFDWVGVRIFVSSCVVEGLRCWFIEPANGMFSGPVYRGTGDAERFAFFCRASLEFLLRTQRQPDILHCHDWSSADVAKAYWNEYHFYGLWKPKVVFTIHNLNYGATAIGEAAYFSQRFTTVSPSYAWEIGGHPTVAPHSGKLLGIRNGIDVEIWNPETDQFLPRGYTADTVEDGKAAAREELRSRLGLTGWGDRPVVGVVTRLTKQKGTHLIAHSCWRTLERGGQFVLLGSAPDPKVQAEFDALAAHHGGENAAFCFAFDEPLSHLIYAASDLILVPSMFEPCGLTQMIAMRYGAVPVVRATGGLRDTVFDVDTDKARAAWEMEGSTNWQADGVDATNGFSFEGTDPGALDYALNRALDAWYNDRAWFRSLQQRVMRQDWSWNKPAFDYLQLYHAAMKQ